MRKNINVFRNSIITMFIFIFIVLYFRFLGIVYIFPNGYHKQTSIFLYIGFILVITSFFVFFFIDLEKENDDCFIIKFLSENILKIILTGSLIITFFIPPVSFSSTVIVWQEIGLLNYFRAIIFVIGLAFLPGACLFSICFPNSTLFERFKVEPFIIKILIYPLLSFIILGVSVLIIDVIGVTIREIFSFILLFLILILVVLDFFIQKFRNKINLKRSISLKKLDSIKISKATLLIIITAIGVSLISFGIHNAIHYLISGDSWTGISPAIYVGRSNVNPIDYGIQTRYPIFWGYVSYGLSILSGIPLINVNALLAPFSYLYIISIYLLMKAILFNFKEKYIILSTILVSIFSGILFITPPTDQHAIVNSDFLHIGALTYLGELNFIYKSFSLYLFFFAIAIFIIITKTHNQFQLKNNVKLENFKLLVISSFFLLISYMIYMLPLIIGIVFILIYIVISDKKSSNIKFFLIFILSLLSFFFLFDFLTCNLNDYLFSDKFSDFLIWLSILKYENNGEKLIIKKLSYLFFLSLILLTGLIYLIDYFYKKFIQRTKSNTKNLKFQRKDSYPLYLRRNKFKTLVTKTLFIFLLSVFTFFIFIEIFNIIYKFYVFKLIFIEQNYWVFFFSIFLDDIILNFGIIGILGIFLSIICYKKDKKLFYILSCFLIFNLIYSSICLINGFYFEKLIQLPPQELEYSKLKYMQVWFSRNWYFIVPFLCIFSAIGIIELMSILKKKKVSLLYDKSIKLIAKLIAISTILIFSYSSAITSAIYWGRTEGINTVKDNQAQVIGWVSENVPEGAVVVTEYDYILIEGLEDMTFCHVYFTKILYSSYKEYEFNLNITKRYNVKYAILYNGTHPSIHPTISDFIDNYLIKYYLIDVIYKYKDLIVYSNKSLY